MHETTHGIFLSSVVDVDAGSCVGFLSSGSKRPACFDRFLAISSGAGVASDCTLNGTLYYKAVTNAGVSFVDPSSPCTSFSLFSRTAFQPGSSIY